MFKWEQNKNWKRRYQFDILLTKIWRENQNLKEEEKQRRGKQKEKIHVIGGQDIMGRWRRGKKSRDHNIFFINNFLIFTNDST